MKSVEYPVRFRSEEMIEVAGCAVPLSSIFAYDVARWNLRALVEEFFDTDALETLHLDSRWNPQDSGHKLPNHFVTRNCWNVSKALREAVIDHSMPIIQSLVFDHIAAFAGPIRSCQPEAMMRVNFHGSRAILRFHRDVEYGQRPNVVNIWLPVTRVFGSNSMYVESAPGLCDFKPVELEYGEAFMFYGTEMVHGTLDNQSGGTRISYDFRFSF
ncbi:hypothetical protein [Janthinobacterium lividum]|uniref:hypothetical protein n=1 Tax=Janthinobacterium lividum TaxID=29581 RepID=UPI000AC4AA88|nr:hypothetical protein [Janthinobacterium lividum]